MISKHIMIAALAIASVSATPTLAQVNNGMSQGSSMQGGSMVQPGMPAMTKSQMASMNKCKAMSSTKMAKDKTCAKMMKMHPDMIGSGGM